MKIPVNKDKPPLLAVKGGKRIYAPPLKPGNGGEKNGGGARNGEQNPENGQKQGIL